MPPSSAAHRPGHVAYCRNGIQSAIGRASQRLKVPARSVRKLTGIFAIRRIGCDRNRIARIQPFVLPFPLGMVQNFLGQFSAWPFSNSCSHTFSHWFEDVAEDSVGWGCMHRTIGAYPGARVSCWIARLVLCPVSRFAKPWTILLGIN